MRKRSQKHCKICKNDKYGPEIHYKHDELGFSIRALAELYYKKLGYKEGQGKFACARSLRAHFEEEHKPAWLPEVRKLALKKENEEISLKFAENLASLSVQLVDGKISDEEYLERVKLISYVNIHRFPEKVSTKHGLDAINLMNKKEAIGVQKSESLRNWFKLISGKPDKVNI